jgi:hypothetical protein
LLHSRDHGDVHYARRAYLHPALIEASRIIPTKAGEFPYRSAGRPIWRDGSGTGPRTVVG